MPHLNIPPASKPLSIKVPDQNNNGTQSTTNGLLSPNSSETLSPPILEATPKKPPKAPLGRPILPMKKSKTLPIHFDEKVPPKVSNGLTNGKKLFVTKPLKEVRTLTLLHGNDNGKIFTSKSPSPSHNRRSTLLSVETGSIAELARRHGSNTLTSRSPSPASYSSIKSSTSNYSTCSSNGSFVPLSRSYSSSSTLCNRSPTPRRMYPQSCDRSDSVDLKELRSKEQAPVVFDANLSFVLGCRKQPVRQRFKPQPAYLEEGTSSNYLSSKIDNFLKRTDHVMDEWRRLGHKDESDLEVYYDGKKRKIGRSKSATNIMIKGFTLFSRGGSRASSVSCRSSRGVSEDRTTVSELDELSEVGGELAEERSAAAVATERADAEAAERLRIERDNRDLQSNNQRLQQASERLELELLHWRSAENGGLEPSDSEGSESEIGVNGEKYKRRFERAHRELQLVRTQLRRQHEDDLEQLVTVKKQLEKKVQDAYEEVEEQRAVAAQWKRKLQKLTNDMADLRSLLDEQTCRNNLLEKRQRKFDSELQNAQEELKRERTAKERLSRERDQANAEKYALEQSLSEARLELELKEERLLAASRSLEEREGGDEVSALRRAKNELERRTRDQEEELDELAGQLQLLESSKLRLEMLLEQQRKEARLEAAARDDEMEETRANAAKKLKILESQLESEHAERSLLLRERHELERRLASLEETARAETQEQAQLVNRLKRDLKRYRALLRDAQTMLEQKEKEGGGKAQIRQLKNQVEDLELAVRAANKARATAEAEASEANAALEEANRAKSEASERAITASREAAAARAQFDDAEEEAAELLKKYRASTNAVCAAQAETRAAEARAEAAAEEARVARERANELSARLAAAEAPHAQTQHENERRLELRNKELESSLELEATSRARLESQVSRLRDAHEQLANELAAARAREHQASDDLRKLTRQIRELKEENASVNVKLSEALRAKSAAESAAASAASEASAARDEARLAARRVAALQEAIAGELSSVQDSRDEDSDNDSYSSDESIGTFLANHKLSSSVPSRSSLHPESQKSHSPEGRASRSSAGSGSKPLTPTAELA
ncbi:unconventional myosin-XVIIIa isoform X3 [Leptidea sinapis]|uniref:unconventional myosin-XVIIIa isoform X3 n=1 Tax=Leptidea sinapis TaxID=189913 RepID=UPI00214516F1|nr:unconventional myosin-XVIIIa isoform X3 [Leptidea sinapis]